MICGKEANVHRTMVKHKIASRHKEWMYLWHGAPFGGNGGNVTFGVNEVGGTSCGLASLIILKGDLPGKAVAAFWWVKLLSLEIGA